MNRTDTSVRDSAANLISRYMCGPFAGENEILTELPQRFYVTGVLYPQPAALADATGETQEEMTPLDDDALLEGDRAMHQSQADKLTGVPLPKEEDEYDRELNLSTDFKPSSFGLSVFTVDSTCRFRIQARYGTYNLVKSESAARKAAPEKPETRTPASVYRNNQSYQRTQVVHDLLLVAGEDGFSLTDSAGVPVMDDGSSQGRSRAFILQDKQVSLRITRRQSEINGLRRSIFTISLINASGSVSEAKKPEKREPEFFIFQPGITVEADDQLFCPGPEGAGEGNHLSDEDRVRNLLFRNYRNYGSGHGASATWNREHVDKETMKINRVEAVVIPEFDVAPVDFSLLNKRRNHDDDIILGEEEQKILSMKRLSGLSGEPVSALIPALHTFTARYGEWIDQQEVKAKDLEKGHVTAAADNILKCRKLLERMDEGVDLLAADPGSGGNIILKAFQDANRAMYMQRVMKKFGDARLKRNVLPGAEDDALPDFSTADDNAGVWRPFQLAFLLSQIQGLADHGSADRETVDLIWFSTGGGKTEAYLGLTAFTIFYRRLEARRRLGDPDQGAGVSVLMRYTLRLLNIQQFNRAAILICACELIRREQADGPYGRKEISTGIWVGRSLTPNSTGDTSSPDSAVGAIHLYRQYLETGKEKPSLSPPISHCPCCGTRIVPERRAEGTVGEWGYFRLQELKKGAKFGPKGKAVDKADSIYYISCRNTKCPFYVGTELYTNEAEVESRKLPVYYVDEVVYKTRPSLLFATVDKFAQLAWNPRTARLFNLSRADNGTIQRDFAGPDLIIQDELHLISSALGTMYGVYEFAVDQLCRWGGTHGAKIVGASATVRNAESQCRSLYGRKNFAQFPPQGIDADDSFFSRLDTKSPGRRYLGVMPSGRTATINIIYLTGRAMQLIPALPFENEDLDWYYTILVYFNSTKELGKFRTLLTDDIAAHRYGMHTTFAPLGVTSLYIPFRIERIAELSSAMTADQIYQYLNRLENARLPQLGKDAPSRTDPDLTRQREMLHAAGVRSARDLDGNKKWRQIFTHDLLKVLHIEPVGPGGQEVPDLFRRLQARLEILLGSSREEPIHVAAATNMISVGVDIARLNIMQIAGQPKSTAEYIQASSRAGREYPGLVVTSYNNAKSRDRSHYESFTDYHQAFYKHVEANSVTPYSLPALEKALPSVLIALMRLLHFPFESSPGKGNAYWPSGPAGADTDKFYNQLISELKERIPETQDGGAASLRENVDTVALRLKNQWNNRSDSSTPGMKLQFAENGHFYPIPNDAIIDLDLFVNHGYPEGKRKRRPAVLTSLRNVEQGSPLIIQY